MGDERKDLKGLPKGKDISSSEDMKRKIAEAEAKLLEKKKEK